MTAPTLQSLPPNRALVLYNETCPYCGVSLSTENSTKDHVIGRRFVPKGKLDEQWNVILNSCRACNNKKSDLEDDLSAISMHPDASGRHPEEDPVLVSESKRKAANSISRLTRKPVKDSLGKVTFSAPLLAGMVMTGDFNAPPQADRHRVWELARLQLVGFFYSLTYNRDTRRGGYMLGGFYPVLEAIRSDWGNPIHRSFMDAVVKWEPRIIGIGADGYFRVAIRRHPEAVCWSWALEWNQNFRIIGFFGELEPAQLVVNTLPVLEATRIMQGDNSWFAIRKDIALAKEDDKLFFWEEPRDDCHGVQI